MFIVKIRGFVSIKCLFFAHFLLLKYLICFEMIFFPPSILMIFTPWWSKIPQWGIADVFCRCHGFSAVVPVFACHHLVASFPALTAITAVSDDQCYTVAGFLSLLRSPLLLSSLLLLVPYCCWLNCFYWRPCYCFLAVACIHDVNGIADIPCCCFGVPLLLASMFLWHTLLLLVYLTYLL